MDIGEIYLISNFQFEWKKVAFSFSLYILFINGVHPKNNLRLKLKIVENDVKKTFKLWHYCGFRDYVKLNCHDYSIRNNIALRTIKGGLVINRSDMIQFAIKFMFNCLEMSWNLLVMRLCFFFLTNGRRFNRLQTILSIFRFDVCQNRKPSDSRMSSFSDPMIRKGYPG